MTDEAPLLRPSVMVHPDTFAVVTLYRDENGVPTGTYGEMRDLSLPLTSDEVALALRMIADAVEERAEDRR